MLEALYAGYIVRPRPEYLMTWLVLWFVFGIVYECFYFLLSSCVVMFLCLAASA